jgi:hypothetical protein
MLLSDLQVSEILSQVSEANLTADILALEAFVTRRWSATTYPAIRAHLLDRLIETGLSGAIAEEVIEESPEYVYFFDPSKKIGPYNAVNIVGQITSPINPDKYIVILAHYDSLNDAGAANRYDASLPCPGASDNASGVAGVLELARVIIESGYVPAHSIIFLLTDGEEPNSTPHLGATAFAEAALAAEMDIRLVINLDMIAFTHHPEDPAKHSMQVYYFPDTDSSDYDLAAALTLKHMENFYLYPVPSVSIGADAAAFREVGVGDSILYFAENKTEYSDPGWNPGYHKPTDTIADGNCMPWICALAVQSVLLTLLELGGFVGPVVGQTPKTRYDDGYKAGSSSDEARPLNGAELVIIENRSESKVDEQVRVGHVKDLVPENASFANMKLAGPNGDRTVSVNRGIVTAIE